MSYRDVEELLAARGIVVTYETVREWCLKFGQQYDNQLRRRRARPGDKWHLDEVFLKINGKTSYLWRAVDQNGNVLDILVQSRRNKLAAKKFFPGALKLLKGCTYVPRVFITDKLGSYEPATKDVMPSVEHRRHRCFNNRAENSHQPTRQRERGSHAVGSVASSLPGMPNVSCPPSDRSASTSARVGIDYEQETIVGNVRADSRHGTR